MTASWLDTTLGDIAEIVSGATPKTSVEEYWDGGIPWATPKDLGELEGTFIESTPRTLSTSGLESCAATLLPAQSVLLSSRAPIGHVAINSVPMATNQGFKNLVPDTARVDSKFLYWWLRFHRPQLEAMGNGATFKEVSKKIVSGVRIQLPPPGEQRRIAGVLDAAEALRAKRRRAMTGLDSLTQAIFIEMFGDPVLNPRGWPVDALTKLGDLDRGVSKHRPRNDPALLGGDWPLIQTGDVTASNGYITNFTATYSDAGLAQSKIWPAGTLCITIAANIAKTGILTFDACFPDSVVGFSARMEGAAEYARCFLNFLQPVLEKQAPESAQKNINLKVLRGLHIPVPPEASIAEFAIRVGEVNALRQRGLEHQANLDALFVSLQQRAFRGEL